MRILRKQWYFYIS